MPENVMPASSITTICSNLQSDDKKKRKNALSELRKSVFHQNSEMSVEEKIQQAFKPVLRCLSDQAEACRELALAILLDIMKYVPEHDVQYLTYIFPVLLQRLGCDEIQEKSEEIRLLLMEFIRFILNKFKPSDLACYVYDLLQIFVRTLVDPYPKVKKESCYCVSDLAKLAPTQFYPRTGSVIKPLLLNFSHQHSKVRQAAVSAVGNVLRYGDSKCMEDVVVPMAERLFDQAPVVRQEVCRVVGMWLVELPDRYSYFSKLIPLMLTCVSDPVPELRLEAWNTWERVGSQYLQENEKDLKDKADYLKDDPHHYPPNVSRPNLGCRTLVERNLCHIVPALVRELDDWLADIRIKSSELMCCLILHSEQHIIHHLEKLLVGMYRASNDEDDRVTDNVERAAELVGYFVPPEVYCKLIVPTMEDSSNAGQLRILAGVLRGSERVSLRGRVVQIAAFLHRPEICHSRKTELLLQLSKCVQAMMTVCQEDCKDISHHCFGILITVMALSPDSALVDNAEGLLKELAGLCGLHSVTELFKEHVGGVLEDLAPGVDTWLLYSPQRSIFEVLLLHAGDVVGLHLDIIIPMITKVLNPENDAEMRLKMFMVLSTILQDPKTLESTADTGQHVATLIKDAFLPNIVWHAGRTAEAIRTAAVVCLYTVLDNAPSSVNSRHFVESISGELTPQLITLVEESSKKTRLYAQRTMARWISLLRAHDLYTADDVLKIFPVVIGRLDDIDDNVRLSSLKTLSTLFEMLPPDFDLSISKGPIEVLFDTLLLHLDDHEAGFQSHVLATLKKISSISPQLLLQKTSAKKHILRNTAGCEELLAYLSSV